MAETKKTAAAKPVAKAAAKATDTKTEEAKTTPAAPVAEEAKKTTTRKTTAKKTTAKKAPVKKAAAEKKAPAKKETTVEPAAVIETVYLQFAGKSYTMDQLVNSAKDIWKFDMNRDENDFKKVELYVKPEESVVYYVINDEIRGSFDI